METILARCGWMFGDLNAVLVKELRQELRVRSFVHAFLWFHVAMILLTVLPPAMHSTDARFPGSSVLFWCVLAVPLLVIIPIRAFSAFTKETQAKELELIFLTRISAWHMVFYKWVALCLQGVLLLTAALPYAIVRYIFGSLNLLDGFQRLGIFLLLMMLFSAIAMMASAWNSKHKRSPLTATILGLLIGVPIINVLFGFGYVFLGKAGRFASFETTIMVLVYTPLFLVLLLEFAASRIAPRAENHARYKRLLGILAVVVGLVLIACDIRQELVTVTVLTYLLPICVGALCEEPQYIQSIYAPFIQGGRWRRPIGALLYPGWASGVLYNTFLLVLLLVLALALSTLPVPEALFGIGALAGGMFLPVVAANALRTRQRGRLLFYLLVQFLLMGLSFMILQFAERHACGWHGGAHGLSNLTDMLISFFPMSTVVFASDSKRFCPVYWATACSLLAIFLLLGIQCVREWRKVRQTQERTRAVLGRHTHHE